MRQIFDKEIQLDLEFFLRLNEILLDNLFLERSGKDF